MCPAIDNLVSCEIYNVIHYFQGIYTSATETHRELYAVYGLTALTEGTVRQWCRTFKDRWKNVHDGQ
jgi:hypothetical protein